MLQTGKMFLIKFKSIFIGNYFFQLIFSFKKPKELKLLRICVAGVQRSVSVFTSQV